MPVVAGHIVNIEIVHEIDVSFVVVIVPNVKDIVNFVIKVVNVVIVKV